VQASRRDTGQARSASVSMRWRNSGEVQRQLAGFVDPDDGSIPEGGVKVPIGYAEFPREILRPPRSVAEKVCADIRRWTTLPRGGHFAAMEQPEALAHEIVEFYRPLRISGPRERGPGVTDR